MRIAFGILLLVAGVVFPMGMLFWLNSRMRRKPLLRPSQIGLLLAVNGTLPLALIIGGLGSLSTSLWVHDAIRIAWGACCLATLVLGGAMLWVGRSARRKENGENG